MDKASVENILLVADELPAATLSSSHVKLDSVEEVGSSLEKTLLELVHQRAMMGKPPEENEKVNENNNENDDEKDDAEDLLSAGDLTSDSDDEVKNDDDDTIASKSAAPVIPPKSQHKGFALPEDERDKARWFRILSPRETKGIDGPYCEEELRRMYKLGDIDDNTMFWTEGQTDWEQLLFMTALRPRLIPKPMLPPRPGKEQTAEAYNPITALPDKLDAINAEAFVSMPMHQHCSRCGTIAVGHMRGIGENQVDMLGLRKTVGGDSKTMSEVVPGLLFVGSSGAAKINPIFDMGITLVINCTSNMGNPVEKLPYFRCRTLPLKDKPQDKHTEASIAAMVEQLDKVYDWIELERISPERALFSDPVPIPTRLNEKTNKFGRPIKSVEEVAIKLRIGKEKRTPRILLWSRKGLDRPVFVAAAYLVRQYGMSVSRAISLLEISRPGALICRFYKTCLEAYGQKYTRGEMLCLDCLNLAKHNHSHTTQNEILISNADLFKEHGGVKNSVDDDTMDAKKLGAYLELLPSETDATKITKLGDVNIYMPKIYLGASVQSGWTGLLDLNLFGHPLGDVTICDLFDALRRTGVSKQLRTIGLGSTRCGCAGLRALQAALCMDPSFSEDDNSIAAGTIATYETRSVQENEPLATAITATSGHGKNAILGSTEDVIPDGLKKITFNPFATDELVDLDLSDNKIGIEGSKCICEILRQVCSLTSLNISYNLQLTDEGCRTVIDAVTPVHEDFGGADDRKQNSVVSIGNPNRGGSVGSASVSIFTRKDERYSRSLTALNISCACVGPATAERLLETFRYNDVLSIFIADYNTALTPLEFKHVLNSIRSYSKCLQYLSLADMDFTVKSFGYLSRLLENRELPLMMIDVTKCGLTPSHIHLLCSYLRKSKSLKRLSIGSNEIGDEAAAELAYAIKVLTPEEAEIAKELRRAERLENGDSLKAIEADEQREAMLDSNGMTTVQGPPLEYVDFSLMDLNPFGSKELLKAACTRSTITRVRLSGNNLGTDMECIRPWLEAAHFQDLHLNNCKLGTKGASTLLNILSDTTGQGTNVLGKYIRALDLSSNAIHDDLAEDLVKLLNGNMIIEFLDLGFNAITNALKEPVQKAYSVLSNSQLEKKIYNLHINVVGNKCNPYMLGEPGMGRAKSIFRYGVGPMLGDDLNDGYSHVNQTSRRHHFERKAANDRKILENFELQWPIRHMN